jgi:glycosyltransferase involved in cell wall biosynthesis
MSADLHGGAAAGGDTRQVLLVVPTASGGLAAHVRMEEQLLERAGIGVSRADVEIGPRPAPGKDAHTVRELRRVLSDPSNGPLTVHAHGLRAGALTALALGTGGRGRSHPRLVVTLHNRISGSRPTRLVGHLLLRAIAARADVVLTVSPDLAETLRDQIPASRRSTTGPHRAPTTITRGPRRPLRIEHAVIPAPQDAPTGDVAPEGDALVEGEGFPDTSGQPLNVLVVGRLAPQKGLDVLLDAVGLLVSRPGDHGTVDVLIAGDGPQHEELDRQIAQQHLPVTLLGRCEHVPALLARADLVVSAARWEGQPVFLQEAIRAGRAIVATDVGGTRLVTGDAAVLVPAQDPGALARAIDAMHDPARRDRSARASRRRARELPGPHALLRQLEDVLELSGGRRNGRGPVGDTHVDDRL